jgi:hypothetical protein
MHGLLPIQDVIPRLFPPSCSSNKGDNQLEFLVIIVSNESNKRLDVIAVTCAIYLHMESPFSVARLVNLCKYSATVSCSFMCTKEMSAD